MKLNKEGYQLITTFEGFYSIPYLDSVKVPTIGYGNTYYQNGKRVTLLDGKITKEQAFEMFKDIADNFAKRVSEFLKKEVTQNQFNSLVSISYNIGIDNFKNSTLLRKVNVNPNDKSIRAEFIKWNKAGGKVLKGLTNRRNAEAKIYFT